MKELYKLKEALINELSDYGKGGLTASTLDTIDKLAHAAKNVTKVIECCEDEAYSSDSGYSRRMSYADDRGRYADGYYVRPDGSYSRGRSAGARRDSMGRYSRSENPMSEDIRNLMNRTGDEQTRHELAKLLDKIDNM